MSDQTNLHANEKLKDTSNYLRGTLLEGLSDEDTGAISKDDQQLSKFHGIYQQDDRDLRKERRRNKEEPAYSFMIRVRVPGGVSTSEQWLEMDRLAGQYANGTLKLTTRQAFQFHGVIKKKLKKTIQEINASLLDTIAACGDVNRNVMCCPNPQQSKVHAEALEVSQKISDHLTPQTPAYHEIWIKDSEGEKVKVTQDPIPMTEGGTAEEPIYGKTYLPRKFKIVLAIPPSNDVDIFAHDLGYIAIVENDQIIGYNITVGGGMGMSHGNKKTFPRLADVLGFCTPDQVVDIAREIVTVQRDYGDRTDRRHARLKYTIEDRGIEWFRAEVEKRLGFALQKPKPFHFENNGDSYGWHEDHQGKHHLTLFIQNGRVKDTPAFPMRTGLREIAKIHTGDFRLTPNQNLIISNITPEQKPEIEKLLAQYKLLKTHQQSALRLHSIACVALPTCGLALAESERYLPELVTEIETALEEAGLRDDAITIRMTGCPNGCARPYISEIALVGRSPGLYNLYLGAAHDGSRLNRLYKERIKSEEITPTLRPIFLDYAQNRQEKESFGDFVIRAKYVTETMRGIDFHE